MILRLIEGEGRKLEVTTLRVGVMMWNYAKKVEETWATAELPPGTHFTLDIESE